jgi:predicted nucleic acid-binding protein
MLLTIDTSALIAVCTNESMSKRLAACTMGAQLMAPHSVHWEIGNALSAMIKRQRIQKTEAEQALGIYAQIPVRWVQVDLAMTLTLVDQLKIYAYDAYLLVCAQQTRTALLTLDEGLKQAAFKVGVGIIES